MQNPQTYILLFAFLLHYQWKLILMQIKKRDSEFVKLISMRVKKSTPSPASAQAAPAQSLLWHMQLGDPRSGLSGQRPCCALTRHIHVYNYTSGLEDNCLMLSDLTSSVQSGVS